MRALSIAATTAFGFAVVSALIGRIQWAVIAGILSAALTLTILRNLTRGDR